MNICLNFKK